MAGRGGFGSPASRVLGGQALTVPRVVSTLDTCRCIGRRQIERTTSGERSHCRQSLGRRQPRPAYRRDAQAGRRIIQAECGSGQAGRRGAKAATGCVGRAVADHRRRGRRNRRSYRRCPNGGEGAGGHVTTDRFRQCLALLRWSQRGLAEILDTHPTTVRRMATGSAAVPDNVAEWLEELAAVHEARPVPAGWQRRMV